MSEGSLSSRIGRLGDPRRSNHGKTKTREYNSWRAMRNRCLSPRHSHYANYGGRGITICASWQHFDNFLADMGPRPNGASLDRIDNNAEYSKKNCRWATKAEQAANRSCHRMIEYNGESKYLNAWAREYGLSRVLLRDRLKMGWGMDKALKTPALKRSEWIVRRGPAEKNKA